MLSQHSVPQSGARPDGAFGRLGRTAPTGIVLARVAGEQAACGGAVLVAVELDVTLEIIGEVGDLTVTSRPAIEQPLEHDRNDVLTAVQEERDDLDRLAGERAAQRVRDKSLHMLRHPGCSHGGLRSMSSGKARAEELETLRPRPDFLHGGEIELEMAHRHAVETLIALLAQDDLVDEARHDGIARHVPGQRNARQLALQAFGQRHEVPHGEHVSFHESAQSLDRVHALVDRMIQ